MPSIHPVAAGTVASFRDQLYKSWGSSPKQHSACDSGDVLFGSTRGILLRLAISCPKYSSGTAQPFPQIPTASVRVQNFNRTGGTFEALRFHIRFALCLLLTHTPSLSDLSRDLRLKLISDF